MSGATVELNNGQKIPIVGLGTWQVTNAEELENALEAALEAGYRHIDTAYMYTNEDIIGRVLQKWLESGRVTRDELFITTKLPPIGMRPEHVPYFLEKSLQNLRLDYVDLYLIHVPFGFQYISDTELFPVQDGRVSIDKETNLEAIWGAMEEQVTKGLTKSIGVSNFSIKQLERMVKVAKIQPANIQVELHAYHQKKELLEVCEKNGISVCAYAPLGSPGRKELFESRGQTFVPLTLLEDPVVVDIAKTHDKTVAQILLRFWTQKNIIVIPKSTNKERLKQNIQLDFELSASEIESLEGLDRGDEGRSFGKDSPPGIPDHPEYNA